MSALRSALRMSALLAASCGACARDFAVAAYLPEWRYDGTNYATVLRTVTHLIFFSLEVSPTGGLGALDRLPRSDVLREARAAAESNGARLMMCVGGNGRSAGFAPMVAKPALRKRFISALLNLCAKKGFDGADLNWEYPGYAFGAGYGPDAQVDKEWRGLATLLKEAHPQFKERGLTLSLAYYPDGRQESTCRDRREIGTRSPRDHSCLRATPTLPCTGGATSQARCRGPRGPHARDELRPAR